MTALRVREVRAADEPSWRELWRDYLAFYRQDLPAPVTDATWRRIMDASSPIFARVAESDGRIVGFSVAVVHEGTWKTTPICYLEDLFVAIDARGCGAGRALIEDLLATARARGWSRLYWHTDADNVIARRLYDRFIAADAVVRYQIALG